MLKKVIVYTLLIAAIVLLFGYFITSVHQNKSATPKELSLYYSTECPHCTKVERFLDANQVMSKLPLVQKQINMHIGEVLAVAKVCHLNPQKLDIPLLWTGKKCVIGDTTIINYLTQQMSAKK